MDFLKRARMGFTSWIHQIPLPSTEAYPEFQSWHHFDPVQQWVPLTPPQSSSTSTEPTNAENPSDLVLLTWNIDAFASQTQDRVAEIITFVTNLDPKVDVIFFQEVSKPALKQILGDNRIRLSWISSECDDTAWGKQSFATITLISKARFVPNTESGMSNASLGPIWRAKFPSRFDRDALCCDMFVTSPADPNLGSKSSSSTRIRLINVHLDSLPIQPSYRPRQISIISSYIHAAGCGVVAGDFNPVLEEDHALVDKNRLTDAWDTLRPEDPGHTWGVDGEQPFPPSRLDKVVVLGLIPSSIKTLQPGQLSTPGSGSQQAKSSEDIPWSDHHGLLSSMSLSAK